MKMRRILLILIAVSSGCATTSESRLSRRDDSPSSVQTDRPPLEQFTGNAPGDEEVATPFVLTAHESDAADNAAESAVSDNSVVRSATLSAVSRSATDIGNATAASGDVSLEDVITSVHRSFPLVQAAFQERQIADGNQLSAWGAFDTKLRAASESGPLGFYETYRNSAGFKTPIYGGGEFFGGYRNGRGDFQPWFGERQTNDGGEFKGGVRIPLIRDRDIDARRADVWRATYNQQIADPVIRASLVLFSREAGFAYWKWVAAGRKYKLGEQWLELAKDRNERIKRRVELQDLDPPELVDNERAIAKREAKLAASLRVLQQSAAKLSLFLRDDVGNPYVPTNDQLPPFPALQHVLMSRMESDIIRAQQNRPELQELNLQLQRLRVDYAEACNMTRPGLDAQLVGSQDVGRPTSKKRDKSEYELEAAVFFDVPLQRRKGRGKMHAVQAKMVQISAKQRMVQDKIVAEVQAVYAGLIQSRQEALKAARAVKLASEMARIERRKFELGESDLLKVALREQYALEAAEEEIIATYNYFAASTEYAAALAIDRPSPDLLTDQNE